MASRRVARNEKARRLAITIQDMMRVSELRVSSTPPTENTHWGIWVMSPMGS
jgi:hypothetical protein